MKFSHLPAFEKHLHSADPEHLSDVYLIVDPEEHVQKKLAKKLLQDGEEWAVYHAEELTLSKIDELLNSFTMFSERACTCIVSIEKLPKNFLKVLQEYLKSPRSNMRLVLTASSMLKDFAIFAKDGVALDLSGEKPWDKEKRLSMQIMQKFKLAQLRASSAICDQIVKMCGSRVALIDQEVEKLSCYLYGRNEVALKDLDIILSNPQQSIFKIGQALFEHHLKGALELTQEQKFPLMMLVYSLRSMVQRSYRLKRVERSDYAQKFPQLKGYLLEKTLKLSNQYSASQFKRMLQILFEIELLMKSQPIAEDFLISLLLIKLGSVLK
ncbi:MAG: hypothetical protein S4CHLAM6_00660 [Chlamydiae bacterium]|nr:hypothetical protein [Chlamydiota bacterium]